VAANEAAPAASGQRTSKRASRLWLWFVAAFLIQLGAWTVWLVIASRHKVQEIPLVPSRG
jgi:hypothetical protein